MLQFSYCVISPGLVFLVLRGPLFKVEKMKGVLTGDGLDGLIMGLR